MGPQEGSGREGQRAEELLRIVEEAGELPGSMLRGKETIDAHTLFMRRAIGRAEFDHRGSSTCSHDIVGYGSNMFSFT